jgi:phospholipase D1/2
MSPIAPTASAHRDAGGERPGICVPGRNCWAIAHAARVAFLVDADAYFAAFAHAVARARERIIVVGWDVQGSAQLQAGPMPRGWPSRLREFLAAALSARPELHAYLLDWDFSLVFALERELLPVVQLGWLSHPRLHFSLDGDHPLTGCHHQKIVVVDDEIAFVGGLDLTTSRWDTSDHLPDDPRRRLPNGKPYGPFHDVQIAVDGEAARRLASLARARWRRATGEAIAPASPGADPWPPTLAPDIRDVDVAIARTVPAFDGQPEVGEVEALYLDSIAAARRWIYVENQYFTSSRIAAAITARLAEPDGPEVVLVMPRICSGWLEERTMGAVRARLLRALRAADVHGHFRVCHPRLPREGCDLNVHAKVMVVDDELARVGSSNLSNRSMGLDTECDVAIDARGDARIASAVAAFRDRLLAEHLAGSPAEVAATLAETGSLLATIDRLGGRPRTLVAFDCDGDAPSVALPDLAPIDLERPVPHAPFFASLLPPTLREPVLLAAARGTRALVGVAATALVWRGTGLGGVFEPVPTTPAIATLVACYLVGTAALVPVAALDTVSALVLGPRLGTLCAAGAATLAAAIGYALGRLLPRRPLARATGRYLDRVSRLLVPGRVRDVAAVRIAGAVPFPIVSMVAGASRVPFVRFLLGTVLVAAPSAAVAALVAHALGG